MSAFYKAVIQLNSEVEVERTVHIAKIAPRESILDFIKMSFIYVGSMSHFIENDFILLQLYYEIYFPKYEFTYLCSELSYQLPETFARKLKFDHRHIVGLW